MERLYQADAAAVRTPEQEFERRWAIQVLRQAMDRLRVEMEAGGGGEKYRQLSRYLTGESVDVSYREVAEKLDATESAVKVAVHRLRRRCADLLRDEVAQTLSDARLLDDEMAFLRRALRSG